MPKKKYKAYWNGHEIMEIEYRTGWVEIIFKMNDYESPLTGTGRYRVLPEDIEIREAA